MGWGRGGVEGFPAFEGRGEGWEWGHEIRLRHSGSAKDPDRDAISYCWLGLTGCPVLGSLIPLFLADRFRIAPFASWLHWHSPSSGCFNTVQDSHSEGGERGGEGGGGGGGGKEDLEGFCQFSDGMAAVG